MPLPSGAGACRDLGALDEPPAWSNDPPPSRLGRLGNEFQFGASLSDRPGARPPDAPKVSQKPSPLSDRVRGEPWSLDSDPHADLPRGFEPGPPQFGLRGRPSESSQADLLSACADRPASRGCEGRAAPVFLFGALFTDESNSARRAASSWSDRLSGVEDFAGVRGVKPAEEPQPEDAGGAGESLFAGSSVEGLGVLGTKPEGPPQPEGLGGESFDESETQRRACLRATGNRCGRRPLLQREQM